MKIGTPVYVSGVAGVDEDTIFYYLGDDLQVPGNCLVCDSGHLNFTVPSGNVHPILQSDQ